MTRGVGCHLFLDKPFPFQMSFDSYPNPVLVSIWKKEMLQEMVVG